MDYRDYKDYRDYRDYKDYSKEYRPRPQEGSPKEPVRAEYYYEKKEYRQERKEYLPETKKGAKREDKGGSFGLSSATSTLLKGMMPLCAQQQKESMSRQGYVAALGQTYSGGGVNPYGRGYPARRREYY
jgi:hypothetical protein